MINNPIIYKLFKDFTNHRKKTNRTVVFSSRPFPNILKYRDLWWNLPTIWKTRLLKTLSQLFETTAGIQSGPDACDKSRFIMTFLTILGVTEILCSFGLVIEAKTGKEIPVSPRLEFLDKFSANNLALSDAEDSTSGSLNRGGLHLLRTLLAIHQKSWELSFWEVIGPLVSLAYASLAASRTLFQQLLACMNVALESEDLSFWYRRKKWFLWTMAGAQAAEWRWLRLDVIFFMRDIYINSNRNPLTNFISSSGSTKFKYTLPWNISEMITKTIPISMRIVRTMRITVLNLSKKVNHLSKVIWDRKIITEFTRLIFPSRIGKPVLMMDVKISEDNISRWVDWENPIYVKWNRIKNHARRCRRWLI